MSTTIKTRFRDAYHKLYGIFPELVWDGTFYRSPHLPMAMSPRRMLSHIVRLETRIAG
jgi:hypothetical protein